MLERRREIVNIEHEAEIITQQAIEKYNEANQKEKELY